MKECEKILGNSLMDLLKINKVVEEHLNKKETEEAMYIDEDDNSAD